MRQSWKLGSDSHRVTIYTKTILSLGIRDIILLFFERLSDSFRKSVKVFWNIFVSERF